MLGDNPKILDVVAFVLIVPTLAGTINIVLSIFSPKIVIKSVELKNKIMNIHKVPNEDEIRKSAKILSFFVIPSILFIGYRIAVNCLGIGAE